MALAGSTVETTGSSTPREWRCLSCSALLGMRRGDELHIKYKELHAVVRGSAIIRCRRCGNVNEGGAAKAAA